jgi:hypothetical protein
MHPIDAIIPRNVEKTRKFNNIQKPPRLFLGGRNAHLHPNKIKNLQGVLNRATAVKAIKGESAFHCPPDFRTQHEKD